MTDTVEIGNKLAKLQEEYKNKLPEKIEEIKKIWNQLKEKNDSETLNLFYRKVHSLHGTSDTFGFSKLGKTAANLEQIIKGILDKPDQIAEQSSVIEKQFQELKNEITALDKAQPFVQSQKIKNTNQVMTIYLLDDDDNWENNLTTQLTTFGYQVQRFSDAAAFVEQIKNINLGIFIIDIDLMNDELKNLLTKKNTNADVKLPIIFLSTNGEFSLRLKAVRLGAVGYYIKPFLIDNLINQINYFVKSESETYKVLIVDDEIDVASYNAAILEQAHMKTCIITKSIEIDKALHEFNPDLILIDLIMPDCNGLELAAIIRQQSIFQSTPIIYLSAEDDKQIQLNAMKLGADDFLNKCIKPEYLIMAIRNRVERYKKIKALMVNDNLTGLYNQTFILNQLEIKLKESLELHNPLSVALIDIDKFKSINDTYGHQAGDHILRSLGLMIRNRLHVNDLVGRYNGEKFLIILPNTTLESAQTIMEELRKHFLTLNYNWEQQIFNASFSVGIASFPEFHTTSELLEAAQESILKSKKSRG